MDDGLIALPSAALAPRRRRAPAAATAPVRDARRRRPCRATLTGDALTGAARRSAGSRVRSESRRGPDDGLRAPARPRGPPHRHRAGDGPVGVVRQAMLQGSGPCGTTSSASCCGCGSAGRLRHMRRHRLPPLAPHRAAAAAARRRAARRRVRARRRIVVSGSRRWLGFGALQSSRRSWRSWPWCCSPPTSWPAAPTGIDDSRFTFRPVAIVLARARGPDHEAARHGHDGGPRRHRRRHPAVAGGVRRARWSTRAAVAGAVGRPCSAARALPAAPAAAFLHPVRTRPTPGTRWCRRWSAWRTGSSSAWASAPAGRRGLLPNAHTDFIFSVIGEEVGLVGCLVVSACSSASACSASAPRPGRPTASARCGRRRHGWIVLQALVNVGAVVGVLPVTGVPLPFVSFGGSSTVIAMAAAGHPRQRGHSRVR